MAVSFFDLSVKACPITPLHGRRSLIGPDTSACRKLTALETRGSGRAVGNPEIIAHSGFAEGLLAERGGVYY